MLCPNKTLLMDTEIGISYSSYSFTGQGRFIIGGPALENKRLGTKLIMSFR